MKSFHYNNKIFRVSPHIIFIAFLSFFIIHASVDGYSQVIQRTGYIFTEIASKISTMPGDSGDHYIEPNNSQLNTWSSTLNYLLSGNYTMASDSANVIGYRLVQFTDTFTTPFNTYYILETVDTNYWGTYVYNPNYCRPLVIQSPHSKRDANTGHQGIHVFRRTEALFYQVNGTHRCNSSILSTCTGTTRACSSNSTAYPVSDLAHTTQSIFQKTTEVLLTNFNNTYFIQLHGFTKLSTDPYVILSNGTQQGSTPDFFPSFSNNLHSEDTTLTFRIAHIDTNWTRLRGFWNTQSRLINNSSSHCNANSTNTNGRFFHIEQERMKLRSNVSGWNKMANALANTFTCIPVSILENKFDEGIKVYPNPTQDFVTVEWNNTDIRKQVTIYNLLGQNMNEQISFDYSSSNSLLIYLSKVPTGLYFLQIGNTSVKVYKE